MSAPEIVDDFVQDPSRAWSIETTVLDVVTLLCPECDEQTPAAIASVEGYPWPLFAAECLHCGAFIGESEWNEVRP